MRPDQLFNLQKKTYIAILAVTCLITESSSQKLNLKPTFKDYENTKNIAFVSKFGGASHVNWVLAIGNELILRNHTFNFLSAVDQIKFGSDFPLIKTTSTGPASAFGGVKKVSDDKIIQFYSDNFPLITTDFEKDYQFTYNYFIDYHIDLALCDHFADHCTDAANMAGIPYIITQTQDLSSESSAPYINRQLFSSHIPTTEFLSFSVRFKNEFIRPFQFLFRMMSFAWDMRKRKRAIGITTMDGLPDVKWKHSLRLVNSFFGFFAPRPIGPLAEYIGPIIPLTYDALTPELSEFLNNHERVAYIAFGHTALPSKEDIIRILSGVLESIEQGSLDGFIWAAVKAVNMFPDTILTASGKTYDIQEMFGKSNPHGCIVEWAPQTAILMHSSTRLFVSHGGTGSWYESMYAGTPMIMFPFFGDQQGNAEVIEQEGVGSVLRDEYSHEQVVDLFKSTSADVDGSIKKSCQRHQAMVQIHSLRGVDRGADLVEEVLYTHEDGILPHREVAANRMSYIKAHNVDIYVVAGLASIIILIIVWIVLKIAIKIATKFENKNNKLKMI